jgi:hypothetical protein
MNEWMDGWMMMMTTSGSAQHQQGAFSENPRFRLSTKKPAWFPLVQLPYFGEPDCRISKFQ